MKTNSVWRVCRATPALLAVGVVAFCLKLEGAPVASDAKSKAVVSDDVLSTDVLTSKATHFKMGRIPASLPIMPVVWANPYDDVPSRLRAAGLLKGPMPLRGFDTGVSRPVCARSTSTVRTATRAPTISAISARVRRRTTVCATTKRSRTTILAISTVTTVATVSPATVTETCQGATVYPV